MIKHMLNKMEKPLSFCLKGVIILFYFILIMGFTGCLEIESRIIIQEDSSAIIKESIRIHKELLDYTDDTGQPIVMAYLEKSACEDRAKLFGTGAVLRSHSIKNLNDGVKLMEAEYSIPDIQDLCITNPYLCYVNYKDAGSIKFDFKPLYEWSNGRVGFPGEMSLMFVSEKKGLGQVLNKGESRLKPPSPQVLQKYRDLQPAFKILMKEFKISFVLECYAPIVRTAFGLRNASSSPKTCEILSFSGANYDFDGGLLLDNDEIMHEILRQNFGDLNITKTAGSFAQNNSTPVIPDSGSAYSPRGMYGIGVVGGFSFRPSKQMFQKYFVGKTIFKSWDNSRGTKLAEFDDIGYNPEKDFQKAPKKDDSVKIENKEEPSK
jgi:hypothetical protein